MTPLKIFSLILSLIQRHCKKKSKKSKKTKKFKNQKEKQKNSNPTSIETLSITKREWIEKMTPKVEE